MPRGAENGQVALNGIALGDDGLARPAEADLIVAVQVVVEPRKRVRPVEGGRRRIRHRQRRRIGREVQVRRHVGAGALVVAEEEQLVLDDRAAEAAAVHVAARLRILLAGLLQEVVRGLQLVALVVLEHAARELVGAALGHAVDDDARRAAVLGRVLVRLHLIFGHRVERHARLRALRSAAARVVVVLPVDEEQVVGGRLAVGAELAAFERPDLQHGHESRNRLHQAELAPVRARQTVDLRAGHVGADSAGRGFDERRLPGHGQRLRDARDLKRQVHRQLLADVDDQAGEHRRLKALQLGLDRVGAGQQRRNREPALAARHDDPLEAGVLVGGRDGDARQHRLRRVEDRAVDFRAPALRERGGREGQ